MISLSIALVCLTLPGTERPDDLKAVIDGLITASSDESAVVRAVSIRALASFETEQIAVFDAITAGFTDDDGDVRFAALSAFKVLRGFDDEKAQFLLAMIKEPDEEAREMALGEISEYRIVLIEPLCQLLTSNMIEDEQRQSLLAVVSSWGPDAAPAVPALSSLIRNKPEFREQAIFALGEIGPAAKDAIPLLLQKLRAPEAETRLAVVSVLPAIAGDSELFAATELHANYDSRALRVVESLIQRYDTDRNSIIEGDEFDAVRSGPQMDRNRDGRLTKSEILRFYGETLSGRAPAYGSAAPVGRDAPGRGR